MHTNQIKWMKFKLQVQNALSKDCKSKDRLQIQKEQLQSKMLILQLRVQFQIIQMQMHPLLLGFQNSDNTAIRISYRCNSKSIKCKCTLLLEFQKFHNTAIRKSYRCNSRTFKCRLHSILLQFQKSAIKMA